MNIQLDFSTITEKNIGQLKMINKETLAVKYSKNFYLAILHQWNKFSWLCYVNDIPIGSLSARLEQRDKESAVYIMTCSVLKAYRRRGIARGIMNHLISTLCSEGAVSLLFLNVWVVSEDAILFYKSLGFEEKERIEGYYKELEPSTALLLELRVP